MVSRRTRTAAVATAAALAGGVLSGCFFYSRWLEQQRMQERPGEKHAAPETLQGSDDEWGGPVKTMRIHAPRDAPVRGGGRGAGKAARGARGRRQPAARGNCIRVGQPRVVAGWRRGTRPGTIRSLSSALDQPPLAGRGRGRADFAIGLVGSVPRGRECRFTRLGFYRPGKHIVMRAMADAAELDAILKGLQGISQDEKNKLIQKRKKHKVTTVLLHEIAHSLGVIHERDAASILSPRYSTDAERFSPEAIEADARPGRAKAGGRRAGGRAWRTRCSRSWRARQTCGLPRSGVISGLRCWPEWRGGA